jgi:hypothetical protein
VLFSRRTQRQISDYFSTSADGASRRYGVVAMCVIEVISAGAPTSGNRPKTEWMELIP